MCLFLQSDYKLVQGRDDLSFNYVSTSDPGNQICAQQCLLGKNEVSQPKEGYRCLDLIFKWPIEEETSGLTEKGGV